MLEDKILGLLPSTLPATIGDLPGLSRNAVGIVVYDGIGNLEYFRSDASSTLYQPVVKIVIRNSSYEQGAQWVQQVREALHRHSDNDFLSILMVGSPMYLGKSDQKLHEFQITFRILTKE